MIHLKLNTVGIKQYQSLIIALQWFVALGRFDILLVIVLSHEPRTGHLERLKRLYGYIIRGSLTEQSIFALIFQIT